MKIRLVSFLIAVFFLPTIASAQEQTNDERKSIDWFYIDANNRPKTLLLKLLQFTAPYPGYYQHEVFAEQSTPHATLNRFKAILKDDASIQKLELY